MAARPTWKGYLKISLVNIPIKVFPASESSATIAFNQLHAACQTRIQQKRWCPQCQVEVPNSDIVKGYQFEKGRYVVLDDADFDKVRPQSTRVIDLDRGIQRIANESQAYYLLGYSPTNTARDGKFRKIKVELVNPAIDYCGLARSLGVEAVYCKTLDEMTAALERGVSGGKPLLIEVETDGSWKPV